MTRKRLVVAMALLIGLVSIWRLYIFVRYSESLVQARILKATPFGTDFIVVEDYVKAKGWELSFLSKTHGFLDQRTRPATTSGEMYIQASVASYYDLLPADITAFWGFDRSGELVDLWVWKTFDGP